MMIMMLGDGVEGLRIGVIVMLKQERDFNKLLSEILLCAVEFGNHQHTWPPLQVLGLHKKTNMDTVIEN